MKRSVVVLFMSVLAALQVQAQFKKGDVELSFSGAVGSWNSSVNSSWNSGGRSGTYDDSESRNFISLSLSPGFYILDGFSIEPEIGLTAIEQEKPAQFLLGNLSYTYLAADARLAPYVRVGYGISNAIPLPLVGGALIRTSNEFDVTVLNAGGGIKYLIRPNAALRVELNYRRLSRTVDYSYSGYSYSYSSKTEYAFSNTALLIGFSIIL